MKIYIYHIHVYTYCEHDTRMRRHTEHCKRTQTGTRAGWSEKTILTQNKHSRELFHPSHLSSSPWSRYARKHTVSPGCIRSCASSIEASPFASAGPCAYEIKGPSKMKSSLLLVIIIIKGIAEESKCRSNSTGKKVQDQIFVSFLIPPRPPPPPHLFLSPFPFHLLRVNNTVLNLCDGLRSLFQAYPALATFEG